MQKTIVRPASWQPKAAFETNTLSAQEYSWLMDTYVLTKGLGSIEAASCQLALLDERMATLSADETTAFSADVSGLAWVRQIEHVVEGEAVIYARTVVPLPTFEAFKADFLSLGTQPIGERLLYDRETVSRDAFQYRIILANEWPYQRAFNTGDAPPSLNARRSMFYMQGYPLLITEVFMSTLKRYSRFSTNKPRGHDENN